MNNEQNGTNPHTLRCAIYTRSATNDVVSLNEQERICRAAAEQRGWVVVDSHIYTEPAFSGLPFQGRKGLGTLLDEVKKNPRPFDCLLAQDTSRISRVRTQTLEFLDFLARNDVQACFVDEMSDSGDPDFRIMLTLNGIMDEQYAAALAKKVHRAQEKKVLLGDTFGRTSYGYKSVALQHPSLPPFSESSIPVPRGHRLEIVESQAPVIRRIYQMFSGGHNASQIADALNGEKVPAPQDSWNPDLVRRILRNEKHRGVITWNKTKRVRNLVSGKVHVRPNLQDEVVRIEAPHLRIVTDRQWNNVHERFNRVKVTTTSTKK